MSKKLKQMLAAYGLVLPSFLTVMLVVAWPILTAIKTSFTDPDTGGFTFDNYKYFFETPRELTNILFTLGIVFLTVALAIVLAYLLALYLRFVKSKVSRLIGNLYLLPRFVPSMVAVYAMITVVRDSGLLNRISQLFGGDFKPGMMYHASGLVTMNMWFNIPFAALMITAGLGAIPDSMIESARDVGASKLRVLRSMILPLSMKDVVIAATFVFTIPRCWALCCSISSTSICAMSGRPPCRLSSSSFALFPPVYISTPTCAKKSGRNNVCLTGRSS